MTVVDASIVVRLLQNREGDEPLQTRFRREHRVHAPSLVDAEVTSAIRGLLLTTKRGIRITPERAEQMLSDFADLQLVRYSLQPLQRRVLELRNSLTAYDAFYVVLAEALSFPLLTDDRKIEGASGHRAIVETWQ